MPRIADSLAALAALPDVARSIESARDGCAALRFHEALRRRIPQAAAESRVRGARASAALEGADLPLGAVRDLVRGARAWAERPDPVELVLRGVVQATAETEHVRTLVRSAPLQALARLHVAAAAGLLPSEQVGRPRGPDEVCLEFVDLGPAPANDVVAERLLGVAGMLADPGEAPAVLVAAVAHAEIATLRPFVRGNGAVARALERALVQASGLDPTGVAVPEVGHGRGGGRAYLGALTAYATGSTPGVAVWLAHCGDAVAVGAQEGRRIADAVLAGRIG